MSSITTAATAVVDAIEDRESGFSQTDLDVALARVVIEQAEVLGAGLDVEVSAEAAPTTATLARVVTSSASAVTLKASNAARVGLYIVNEAVVVLYVKFGSTATSTDYSVAIPAGVTYEMPNRYYSGIVTGRLASGADSAAQVTEL